MKVNKDAIRAARQLMGVTLVDGKVDGARAKDIVKRIAEKKPRNYLGILTAYQRLLRLELEKRHAVIESAKPLGELQDKVVADLKKKYGDDLTTEFRENAELLGGLRVKVGADVWDGSVKSRLDRLRDNLL